MSLYRIPEKQYSSKEMETILEYGARHFSPDVGQLVSLISVNRKQQPSANGPIGLLSE